MAQVKGTGPAGRITKDDVTSFLGQGSRQTAPAQAAERQEERAAEYGTSLPSPPAPILGSRTQPQAPASVSASSPAPQNWGGGASARPEERIKMTRRRQTIATRLVEAQHTAAMLTTFNEIDMTAVMAIRARRKDTFKEKNGIGLGFMSFSPKRLLGRSKRFPC